MEGYAGTCMKDVRTILVEIRDLLKAKNETQKESLYY
jgi:hypothetical protein